MHFKVIACDVLTREVCQVVAKSPHTVDLVFTAKGEHNVPQGLRALLQGHIDAASAVSHDAVLLVYGLCGNAVVGLTARDCPLVLPRAHDCTTLFLGSKASFETHFGPCPSRAWTSVGYSERGDSILSDGDARSFSQGGLSFAELAATYGEENARYLMDALSTCPESDEIPFLDVPETHVPEIVEGIRERIRAEGKKMMILPGGLDLIRDLIEGHWREDHFLIVPPGARIEGVYDYDQVVRAVAAE